MLMFLSPARGRGEERGNRRAPPPLPASPPSWGRGERKSGEPRRLLYYFVSSGQQRGRHCEVERLRGLRVDDEFVTRRLFHRNVAG